MKIFNSNVEIVENEDADIYGCGFNDFYFEKSEIENIQIKNKDKINILITHGTLDGGNTTNFEYNPIHKNILKQIGFDYVALGHIHKLDYNTEQIKGLYTQDNYLSRFDELGKHGVILGEITKENISLEFLNMDLKEFKEINMDISDILSEEELIEKINELELSNNIFYKINLIGKRNFEINIYNLYKFILNENIIKLKIKHK